jgi:hypothetical protein
MERPFLPPFAPPLAAPPPFPDMHTHATLGLCVLPSPLRQTAETYNNNYMERVATLEANAKSAESLRELLEANKKKV